MYVIDQDYMKRAIELAKKGEGWTNPNPMVGAVIVKDGRIIGEGYHARCGELHAERNAIASLTESAEGATLYIGTMLSLWKDAAVYGSNFRAEDKKSSDWIQRPKSESGRKGSEDIKRCRCSGCGRFYERQM